MASEYAHTLFIAPAIDVYQIPPRPPTGGHQSGSWRTDAKMFSGRLRAVALSGDDGGAEIRLEDPNTGDLFAVCPIPPGERDAAVEAAADSSRNFVLRLVDAASGRRAFVGLSFADRGTAFDFNVALTDHAKHERRAAATSEGGRDGAVAAAPGGSSGASPAAPPSFMHPDDAAAEAAALSSLYNGPAAGDMSLKAGESIRVKLGSGDVRPVRPAGGGGLLARLGGGGGGGGLAPPPTGLAPPPPPPPPTAGPPANDGWATFE